MRKWFQWIGVPKWTIKKKSSYCSKTNWLPILGQSYLEWHALIGQILNFDDTRHFQNRGTEHIYVPIRIVDAPKIDENNDSQVIEFIDKYITCVLPDEEKYTEMNKLLGKCKPTIIKQLVE